MILAPKLKRGNTIGIIVPSKPCTKDKFFLVKNFISYIESIWCKILLSQNFMKTDKFKTSGWSPKERARDFNMMIKNKEVNWIWCLQGGNTLIQMLEFIDFEQVKKNPKIIIGKSDIDMLIYSVYSQTGIIWFHGPDPKIGNDKEMDFKYSQEYFYKRLFLWEKNIATSNIKHRYALQKWKARGTLIGCSISSLLRIAGTKYFPKILKDFIFFIETYNWYSSLILSELTQLKYLWFFKYCKWVVIWNNNWFEDTNNEAEDIIVDFIYQYNIPIIKTNEFGHYQPHAFLPIWAQVSIDADSLEIKICSDFIK